MAMPINPISKRGPEHGYKSKGYVSLDKASFEVSFYYFCTLRAADFLLGSVRSVHSVRVRVY